MKKCIKCQHIKPLDNFYTQKGMADGHLNKCKYCVKQATKAWQRANPEKLASNKAATYRRKGRERMRKWRREKQYGITEAAFNQMLAKQMGGCSICKKELKAPVVDHCHLTGKVRGLLCHTCNSGLGMFKDNLNNLIAASVYIDRAERL